MMPQFLRYLIAGLLATGLDYGLFVFLERSIHYLWAHTLAYAAGFMMSFSLNKWWVFSGKQQYSGWGQLLRFCLLAAFNYVMTALLLYVMVDGLHMYPPFVKFLAMALMVCWNFVVYKRVVYR